MGAVKDFLRAQLLDFFLNSFCRVFTLELGGAKLAGGKVERGKSHALAGLRNRGARKLFSSELNDESAAVPGVTTRVTSRRTSFLAMRGSSTCSQMATLNPLRISFEMYPSAA